MKKSKLNTVIKKIKLTGLLVLVMGLFLPLSCTTETVESNLQNAVLTTAKYSYSEMERLEKKIRPFQNFNVAKARGYTIQATEYRCGMGFHYLNPAFLDDTFDLEKPEVLLYVPDENGVMQLVGVEYATPIADLKNPPTAPEGFLGSADTWEISTEFSLWTLHAWPILENPCGFFAPRNPILEGAVDCALCD